MVLSHWEGEVAIWWSSRFGEWWQLCINLTVLHMQCQIICMHTRHICCILMLCHKAVYVLLYAVL